MLSLPTLNVLLALVTGVWLLVSVAIVVDRARYDARNVCANACKLWPRKPTGSSNSS